MECPGRLKMLQLLRGGFAGMSRSSDAIILADADSASSYTASCSVANDAAPASVAMEQRCVRCNWRRRIWQTANCLACLFFLVCAGFQFNDPDPYVWIPIYAIPGFLALVLTCYPALTATRLFASLMCLHTLACLAAFGFLGYAPLLGNNNITALQDPLSLWQQDQQYVTRKNRSISDGILSHEECIEALGLLLILGWLVAQLMVSDLASRSDRFARPVCLAACLVCLSVVAGVPTLLRSKRILCLFT